MDASISQGMGQVPGVEAVQVVVLHDDTGAIVHQHTVVMFSGGRMVPEAEAVEAAREQGARLGHRAEELQYKVSSNPEHSFGAHRIDTETGKFVRISGPDFDQRLTALGR